MEFGEFQDMNRDRCERRFHQVADWSIYDWALAIAGEAGELCNLLKKIRRGDFTLEEKKAEVVKEIADVITYCDLTLTRLGVRTGQAVMDKFLEVSARVGYQGHEREQSSAAVADHLAD